MKNRVIHNAKKKLSTNYPHSYPQGKFLLWITQKNVKNGSKTTQKGKIVDNFEKKLSTKETQ